VGDASLTVKVSREHRRQCHAGQLRARARPATLPGETLDAALGDLRALLTRAKRDDAVEAEITTIRTKAGPTETAVDDPLVCNAVAISRAHGVAFPQPGGLTGWCDLVHFHDVGAVGIVLGPAGSTKDCLARRLLSIALSQSR
jgi:acetylornithine deacetylase/succinyl-diaminopimelate desuccinylase